MKNANDQIIIKRQRRRSGKGKAGGAWKVAFADFTLAMMALFLVLWILAISDQEERAIVAYYLRTYSILDAEANPFDLHNSPYPVDLEGQPSVLDEPVPKQVTPGAAEGDQILRSNLAGRENPPVNDQRFSLQPLPRGRVDTPAQIDALAKVIDQLAEQLQVRGNLVLEIVPQGLRVQIRDDLQQPMFTRGSAQLTPVFRQLLLSLAPVFGRIDNRLMISGHTDSTPYASPWYGNWELSGDRAQKARRVLESGGMPADRAIQVVAMSDRVPVDKQDPQAGSNRRIELLVLTGKAEQELSALFDRPQTLSPLSLGEPAAASAR